MIWDLLNQTITNYVGFISGLYSGLPQSPLYIDSATITALSTVVGYAAWFIPIVPALSILGVYVAGLAVWFLVVVTIHFVEQIAP